MSCLMIEDSRKKASVRLKTVEPGLEGQRVDNFLAGLLTGAPRSLIYKIIRTGQVRVNGGRVKASTRLEAGDQVRIPPVQIISSAKQQVPAAAVKAMAEAILFENGDHLVINKPSGIAVHGGSGVSWGVIDAMRALRPGQDMELVHRLDRETSGCLVLATNKGSMRELQRQFRCGEVEKAYLCLMGGRMPEPRMSVDQPLLRSERAGERFMQVDPAGKPAWTEFRLLEHRDEASYAEAVITTGRTHQIRAHAAFLGMPLAGDARYGTQEQLNIWRQRGLNRLFLHAHRLTVFDQQGNPLHFTCPLPDDLRGVLDRLSVC
jgi:23S rRNA pseudouridine955/2504/2580 synthase